MTLDEEVGRLSGGTPVTGPRTVTFVSGKGGVGTTVLLLSTAVLLARRRKRVLVLDGNFGLGNAQVLLGCSPRFDIRHVVAGERRLTDVLLAGPEGIRIIPAASGVPELANLDPEDIEGLLCQVREMGIGYDFLLIDAGSGLGASTLKLVLAADEAIVVTRPEPTAIVSAYALMKVVVLHRVAFPFHLLLNMVRDGNQAGEVYAIMAEIAFRFLGYRPGSAGFVVEDTSVRRSVVDQVPFVLQAPRSDATACLTAIVEKLAPKESGIAPEAAPPFWRRMFSWRR